MQIDHRHIGALEANCYIVNGRVMIDPGDSAPQLDAFIRDIKANIGAVVITHGHFDHMLGAAHIKKTYGAKVFVSEADAPSLRDKSVALCLPYGVTPFEPVNPDVILSEGACKIDGIEFEVMFAPGHTPGGICLINHAEKCVFTGDTLFRFGYGRTDLPGGNEAELFRSIRRLMRLPGDYYIYPGHGEGAFLSEIAAAWR